MSKEERALLVLLFMTIAVASFLWWAVSHVEQRNDACRAYCGSDVRWVRSAGMCFCGDAHLAVPLRQLLKVEEDE